MSAEGAAVRPQDLPEFSEDWVHCEACDWADAATEFVNKFEGSWTGIDAVRRDRLNSGKHQPLCAYLKRTCTRCGFEWAERLAGQ